MNCNKFDYSKLEKILSSSKILEKYTDDNHDEPSAIALAICDLLKSMELIVERTEAICNQIELSDDSITDFLQDVDSELEHIIYHIRDCQRFNYLLE